MENIFLLTLIMSETNLPNFVTTFVKSLHHALKLIFPISWKPQICQILSKKKGTVYPPDHVLDIPKSLLIPLSSQRLPRSRAHRRGTGATRASCHRTPRRWRRCGWTRRRATRSSPSPSRSSGRSPATSARTPSSAAAASAASTRAPSPPPPPATATAPSPSPSPSRSTTATTASRATASGWSVVLNQESISLFALWWSESAIVGAGGGDLPGPSVAPQPGEARRILLRGRPPAARLRVHATRQRRVPPLLP